MAGKGDKVLFQDRISVAFHDMFFYLGTKRHWSSQHDPQKRVDCDQSVFSASAEYLKLRILIAESIAVLDRSSASEPSYSRVIATKPTYKLSALSLLMRTSSQQKLRLCSGESWSRY